MKYPKSYVALRYRSNTRSQTTNQSVGFQHLVPARRLLHLDNMVRLPILWRNDVQIDLKAVMWR
jgi:hypothetical protein